MSQTSQPPHVSTFANRLLMKYECNQASPSPAMPPLTIPVPPPAYSAMPSVIPLTATAFSAYSSLSDSEDDEDLDEDHIPKASPITITVDASIAIDGQNNTLLLPPSPSPNPRIPSTAAAAIAAAQSSGRIPMTGIRAVQQARAERLTAVVLAALKQAGAFDAGKESRAVNVKLNAGVTVEGRGNILAMGGVKVVRNETASKSTKHAESKLSHDCDRKRRAESEPAELRISKKAALGVQAQA